MGKPIPLKAGCVLWKQREQTRGSETSQYPEEKRTNVYSLSSGERKGRSLNQAYNLLWAWGCKVITFRSNPEGVNKDKTSLAEWSWKGQPKKVIVL